MSADTLKQAMIEPEKYLNTLISIKNLIDARDCTPDKLLMELGQYTLDIEYEGEEYEENCYDTIY